MLAINNYDDHNSCMSKFLEANSIMLFYYCIFFVNLVNMFVTK